MILNINDYLTQDEKRELYQDALEFAKRKKEGTVVCRVCKFLDTDTPEQTQQKLKQHAYWRYVGNVAQRVFVNFIQSMVGEIEHDILIDNGTFKRDIDTVTRSGLNGDVKSSDKSKYLQVNSSDLRHNDIFIKIHINPTAGTFEICGFATKQYILKNGTQEGIYHRVEYKDLNHNIQGLIDMYRY